MPKMRLEIGRQDRGTFRVPAFGHQCVCCNKHAMGRTQDYDASTDRIHADAFPVPVCHDCKDHALEMHGAAIFQMLGFLLGGCGIWLGFRYRSGGEGDLPANVMIAVCTLMFLATFVWHRRDRRRKQRELAMPGHHPRLEFSIVLDRPILDTRNGELVARILASDPDAHQLKTPWAWRRAEAKELAHARVVKSARPAPQTPRPATKPVPLVAPPVPPHDASLPDKPSLLD